MSRMSRKEARQVPVCQVLASYFTNFQHLTVYSSTAACAAANRCWLSEIYKFIVKCRHLFSVIFCTFLHADDNFYVINGRYIFLLCKLFQFWFYNKLLDFGLTILNSKYIIYSEEPCLHKHILQTLFATINVFIWHYAHFSHFICKISP